MATDPLQASRLGDRHLLETRLRARIARWLGTVNTSGQAYSLIVELA